MLQFLWSALSWLGLIVLIVLIVVIWTVLEQRRKPHRSDDQPRPGR